MLIWSGQFVLPYVCATFAVPLYLPTDLPDRYCRQDFSKQYACICKRVFDNKGGHLCFFYIQQQKKVFCPVFSLELGLFLFPSSFLSK